MIIAAALGGLLCLGFVMETMGGTDAPDTSSEDEDFSASPTGQVVPLAEFISLPEEQIDDQPTQELEQEPDLQGLSPEDGDVVADHEDHDMSDPVYELDLTAQTSGAVPVFNSFIAAEDQIVIEYEGQRPEVSFGAVVDGNDTYSSIQLNGEEVGRVLVTPEAPLLGHSNVELVALPHRLGSEDDYYVGSPEAETLFGRQGDDTINGGGGADTLNGGAGEDVLISHGSGGRLAGISEDDYLEARKTSYGQYHLFGGEGDDTIVMHQNNASGWGHQGFHAYGGEGADEFHFVGTGLADAPLVSRINDFDATQDSIWVDDVEIDLDNLAAGMRLVSYHDQQWLAIDDNILIGLEGFRMDAPAGVPTMGDGTMEMHFHAFPTNLADLPTVPFINR